MKTTKALCPNCGLYGEHWTYGDSIKTTVCDACHYRVVTVPPAAEGIFQLENT